MRPLSDYATTLFLALAARHVSAEPMLADAAAIIAGRIRKWSIWEALPESQQTLIAQGLRLRPSMLAQPKRFMTSAEAILKSDMSPFELVNSTNLGFELHERDRYRVSPHLDVDHLIRENFEALKNGRPASVPVQMPETGDVVLKHITGDQIRVFQIPVAERGALSTLPQRINIAPSVAVPEMSWDYQSLEQLAQQLDLEPSLHSQHTVSLRNIWGDQATREAKSGSFYRVNAPTGTGKSVVMLIMAIDAARRGHKVVIAVPTLVDLYNTVQALKQSAAVTAKDLKIAPLHSASRIHERAELHFAQHSVCLLYTSPSPRDRTRSRMPSSA